MSVVSMKPGRNLNELCFENSEPASVLFDWHSLFSAFHSHLIFSFLICLLKNEDLTSEAGLSNWSKGTLRCGLVAQFGLLTCYLKVMLQMAFLCMRMDFVNGRDCLKNCYGVSCKVNLFLMGFVCQKMNFTKRILIYTTILWLMVLTTKFLLNNNVIKIKTPLKFYFLNFLKLIN